MAKQKNNNYFQMFVQGVSYSCEAAALLHQNFVQYDPEALQANVDKIHLVEHTADLAKHDLMGKLLREFITPIDREDIIDMAGAIDDVTDTIEDVLVRMYMFNVQMLRPEAIAFAALIADCCKELLALMQEFEGFRKSKTISKRIVALNRLEEEGDKLYITSVRSLHTNEAELDQRMVWTTLFELLEKCCDRCEDVADVVERVILKNS